MSDVAIPPFGPMYELTGALILDMILSYIGYNSVIYGIDNRVISNIRQVISDTVLLLGDI